METQDLNAVPQEVHLFYQDSRSDKTYDLKLQQCDTGWSVYAAWGRRGSTLQSDYKCERESYEAAKGIFDATLKAKLAKGYQYIVSGETPKQSSEANVARAPISKQVVFSAELLTRIDSESQLQLYVKSPRYFLQTKRDGVRLTIVAESRANIYGYNKLGQVVPLDAKLHAAVVELLSIANITHLVMDGEWEASGFWAWDLLHLDYDTRGMRYEDRLDLLQELLAAERIDKIGMFRVVATGRTESLKADLLRQAKRTRAEGVCIKNKDAQYRGGRNGQHYKFKFESFASVIVGPKPKQDGHRSVGMYVFDKGRKRYVGSVKIADRYPVPADGAVIDVRYLYILAGSDARLYQPCWFGTVRTDVRVEDCLAEQFKLKQDAQDAAA